MSEVWFASDCSSYPSVCFLWKLCIILHHWAVCLHPSVLSCCITACFLSCAGTRWRRAANPTRPEWSGGRWPERTAAAGWSGPSSAATCRPKPSDTESEWWVQGPQEVWGWCVQGHHVSLYLYTGFVRVLEILTTAWISKLCFQGLKSAGILV